MIYILTHGEYSDFGIDGVYEGLPGLDLDAAFRDFWNSAAEVIIREDKDTGKGWPKFDNDDRFAEFLRRNYGLTPADRLKWWVANYSYTPVRRG